MIKLIFLTLFFYNYVAALNIEAVEKEVDNSDKSSYMKDGRMILNPIDNNVLKSMESIILSSLKDEPLKAIEIRKLESLKNKVIMTSPNL